jgi:hypothetical protein
MKQGLFEQFDLRRADALQIKGCGQRRTDGRFTGILVLVHPDDREHPFVVDQVNYYKGKGYDVKVEEWSPPLPKKKGGGPPKR